MLIENRSEKPGTFYIEEKPWKPWKIVITRQDGTQHVDYPVQYMDARMRKFYGEFNGNGYTIYEQGVHDRDPEYQAGNCRFGSSQTLPVGGEGTCDIATLEEYCNSTGAEIAKENNGEWLGCSQIDDYDIEY